LAFEIKEKDLLARIGKLKTKSSTVETPLLFPVVNPVFQSISPRRIMDEFGFEALITNAYILKQRFQKQPTQEGLHRFLGFNGTIMTDSGAYQTLVYGDIQTNPEEIVRYQEQIDTDIATILDIPTGWEITEKHAAETVKETLKRAEGLFKHKSRDDILWVGPVQGGRYLDLVVKSAKETGKLPFQIHALGSPTEVMERYRFDVLVDMIMAAKTNLPVDRPLHLFGAGHPFMFALAVSLGCDLFDSAAYALYAREGRYMTENGTYRLNEMDYFPCACPKCTGTAPKRVLEMPQREIETFLAEHNLHVCGAEIRHVKQAIKDGRLWEHLETRAHSHPALFQAMKKLIKYQDYIEKHDPITKNSGLFFYDSTSLMRPEVLHYQRNLKKRHTPPGGTRILLLVPQTQIKPFHNSKEYRSIAKTLRRRFGSESKSIHVCFYAAPFGVIPVELDEVYPLSQHETVLPLDNETVEYVANQTLDYINRSSYKGVLLLGSEGWQNTVEGKAKRACRKKGIPFKHLGSDGKLTKTMLARLMKALKKMLSE
jgi:7-cyano-7-deazaguanine tRNA-ribosyltransferase